MWFGDNDLSQKPNRSNAPPVNLSHSDRSLISNKHHHISILCHARGKLCSFCQRVSKTDTAVDVNASIILSNRMRRLINTRIGSKCTARFTNVAHVIVYSIDERI